ncbi:MAG: potassium channel family protein [Phycisphaerae bacterium]
MTGSKRTNVAAATAFVLFIALGGVWFTLVRFVPAGVPRNVVVVAICVLFSAAFIYLLVARVYHMFTSREHLALNLVLVGVTLVLLLVAYASVYQSIGIAATAGPQQGQTVNDFWTCLYFSVETFTTVGFGDFRPIGLGRVIAAIEALVGYLVLGMLASTTASLLQSIGQKQSKSD